MKFLRRIFSYKDFWPIVIVLTFGILAGRSLLTSGYFIMHDDLQMMRQFEMEKCFLDGQIPCRWVPDLGFGYGFPLFNFYPPLPYLIGQGIRLFGFAFTDTVKLTFSLSLLVSGIGMYFLAKEFFGRFGGIVSSVFYIWAPYHAVDIYVRGAMNEAWALALFPLILWTSYRLINEKKNITKWVIGLALSWFGLLTSHNLMVLIFAPVFLLWLLLHLVRKKAYAKIPHLAVSGILALGLASFFTLPALVENGLTHLSSAFEGYFDFAGHFVTVNQLLFSRFWGYGGSAWEISNDGMSFQIGKIHWILSLVIFVLLIYRYIKTKKVDNLLLVSVFFFLIGWFSAFMAHSRSTPIWLLFAPLKYVQFPWRFLTIVILAFSFLMGALPGLILKGKKKIVLGSVMVIVLVFLNWSYFLPKGGKMGPLTDEEKFTGVAWELQQNGGINDYLPINAKIAPDSPRKILAEILKGKGEIKNMELGTNWASFDAAVESEKAQVRIGIFHFPNWRVFVDGAEVGIFIPEEESWGRMYIELSKGSHEVYLKIYNTTARTASNVISLITWTGLLTFPFWKRKLGVLKSRHGDWRAS